MKQHVRIEASLERKASATLRAAEGLLSVRSVDSLVGFELQQLGEGFPAVFAAQRLLFLTLSLLLRSAPSRLELYSTFRSGGVSRVTLIWIFWLQLTERIVKKCLFIYLFLANGHCGRMIIPAYTDQKTEISIVVLHMLNTNWLSHSH